MLHIDPIFMGEDLDDDGDDEDLSEKINISFFNQHPNSFRFKIPLRSVIAVGEPIYNCLDHGHSISN